MPKPRVVGQPASTQHFTMGINAMADLLAPTLGPIGGIVANQRDHQRRPELLDDSATTVRRILEFGDKRKDVGAMLMRSMIWRVVQRAGDGGATAAILARSLYAEAVRMIASGINAMELSRGANLAVDAAVEALHAQTRPVRTEGELANVALTVIREPALAAVLGEMSYLLGPDAHVTVEKYVASYLQQYYYPGASYRMTSASMYLYTDQVQKQAVLTAGALALVDGKLERADQVVPLIKAAVDSDAKTLTIVGGSFSDEVISILVANSRSGGDIKPQQNGKPADARKDKKAGKKDEKKLVIFAAKPKDVGDDRRAVFDDLAMITGATVFGRSWSKGLQQATAEDLGATSRVDFSSESMHVVPERQNSAEVRAKVAELRTRIANMTLDDEDRPLLVKRLSAMTGGMGVLKIGTESKLDREVRAQNAERTLKVLSAAQHSGVVPGGGAAYFHCIPNINVEASGEVAYGVEIVKRALAAPLRQILDNAHVSSSSVIMDKIRQAGPTYTYDVVNEQLVDAYEAGVLDVTNVLATVLRTSISAALMAVTTDAIVYHKKPEQALTP